MRPITEQVDEFIEDVFNGDVITLLGELLGKDVDWQNAKLPIVFFGGSKIADTVFEILGKLINELIPKYLQEDSGEGVAPELFHTVLRLRMIGGIKNNADTLKETTYWKSRCLTVELELNKKDDIIQSLNNDITKLRVGAGGIK